MFLWGVLLACRGVEQDAVTATVLDCLEAVDTLDGPDTLARLAADPARMWEAKDASSCAVGAGPTLSSTDARICDLFGPEPDEAYASWLVVDSSSAEPLALPGGVHCAVASGDLACDLDLSGAAQEGTTLRFAVTDAACSSRRFGSFSYTLTAAGAGDLEVDVLD